MEGKEVQFVTRYELLVLLLSLRALISSDDGNQKAIELLDRVIKIIENS